MPQIILIMGLFTCLYAWRIAFVTVIIDDRNIDIPNKDNSGAVYSISSTCDENNSLKIGLLNTEIPKPAGKATRAVNFKDEEITDLSRVLSYDSIAAVNIGTNGRDIAVTNVDGKLYIDTAIVL